MTVIISFFFFFFSSRSNNCYGRNMKSNAIIQGMKHKARSVLFFFKFVTPENATIICEIKCLTREKKRDGEKCLINH